MTYEELVIQNEKLQQQIKDRDIEINNLKIKVENQQLQINLLNRYVFGAKRESTPTQEENLVEGTQCSIFGEVKDEEIKEQVEEETEEITVNKKKNKKKKTAGIKKSQLKDIETETREYFLDDDKKVCNECGANLKEIGKELVRQEINISLQN